MLILRKFKLTEIFEYLCRKNSSKRLPNGLKIMIDRLFSSSSPISDLVNAILVIYKCFEESPRIVTKKSSKLRPSPKRFKIIFLYKCSKIGIPKDESSSKSVHHSNRISDLYFLIINNVACTTSKRLTSCFSIMDNQSWLPCRK